MDADRFDHMTRMLGEQRDRRGMVKAATGSALAVLGMGALGRAALGQEVSAEGKGFKGNKCDNNNDCKKGLVCNNKGKCEYKKNCGGKKGDACKKDKDCCKNKNLKCENKKCKRQ